ncbi:MAG: hypothetical protein IJ214_12975 [Clostridia bacterium]|nr:hypothetical protein [Clostridia bacterium]
MSARVKNRKETGEASAPKVLTPAVVFDAGEAATGFPVGTYAKGRRIGRRPTTKDDIPAIFYKHYPAYIHGDLNVTEFARVCGLSRQTVYKYLRMCGEC